MISLSPESLWGMAAAGLASVSILLSWPPNPPEEEVTSYTVYASLEVGGPYYPIQTVSGTNATLAVTPGRAFYFVTASNAWGRSLPSNTVNTPAVATAVQKPTLTFQP